LRAALRHTPCPSLDLLEEGTQQLNLFDLTQVCPDPEVVCLSSSHSASPSIRSMGGVPSRVGSCFASAVKVPVVINRPLSPRPASRAEVPYGAGPDAAGIALALEEHRKADERKLIGTRPINAAIPALAGDDRVDEAGLPKQPLRDALEAVRSRLKEEIEQVVLPAGLTGLWLSLPMWRLTWLAFVARRRVQPEPDANRGGSLLGLRPSLGR
jgi:hypothetical protein